MELQTNIDSGDVKIKRTSEGETTITKEPELVTRVSQVKVEKAEEKETKPTGETEIKEPEFDVTEIEKIKQKDPEAGAWAEKAYKSFQKGFNNKYQEIAELRKKLETQAKPEPIAWTPQRLQQEINKPDFVSAAQEVVKNQNPEGSGLTDVEYSTLSEKEKQKLQNMEKEILILKRENTLAQMKAQDEQLKVKYANYDPKAIDIITADMIAGRVQATREHLFKVLDYEDAVHRAYELGKQDKQLTNEEKVTSMSPEGTTAQATEGAVEREKNETDRAWFIRNALNRLAKSKTGETRK
jgi:hypothetical protein